MSSDQQVRADQVWSLGNTGGDSSSRVPVAILDTGIDNNHPEFAGRIILCHSEITGTNACQDQNGHGTHVAGIVGATGVNSNAKGIASGVSYEIDQVLDSTGSGSFSDVISGIDWAVANHAKVISMSLGSSPLVTTQSNCDSQSIALTTAINNAVNAGVTVVAAAGNSGTSGVGSPGCMSNVIAVGAVNSANTIASFSSQGGPLADHGITAPGVSIFSSVPSTSCSLCDSSGYRILSGTSMATPQVSGIIALMIKGNPTLTPTAIKNILFNSACNPNSVPSCSTGTIPNNVYGHGRIDALRAIGMSSLGPSVSIYPPSGTYSSPQSVTLTSSAPSTIYYTIDGSNPTTSSTSGASPVSLNVSTNSTLKFFAKDSLGNTSPIGSAQYVITTSQGYTQITQPTSYSGTPANLGTTNLGFSSTTPFSVSFTMTRGTTIANECIVCKLQTAFVESPGWGIWTDGQVINFQMTGQHSDAIRVRDTVLLDNNQPQNVLITYDGSGLASGVTFSVNGSPVSGR